MTGTSAWIAADGALRPSRAWSAMNGRTVPSRQREDLAIEDPVPRQRRRRLDDLGIAAS